MKERGANLASQVEIQRVMESKRRRYFPGSRRGKFYLGGAIIVLALGALIYSSMIGSTTYYLTVGELQAKSETMVEQDVRVGAKVVPGSIKWDQGNQTVSFEVVDEEGARLPVTYAGLVPDAFRDDSEVVIEGRYSPGGSFQAHTLLAKCPSKYVPVT